MPCVVVDCLATLAAQMLDDMYTYTLIGLEAEDAACTTLLHVVTVKSGRSAQAVSYVIAT